LATIGLVTAMLAVLAPGAEAVVNTCKARNLTKDTPVDTNLQRVIIHLRDLLARYEPADRDTQLGADMPGDQVAVTGNDLDGDTGLLEGCQRRSGTCFGRIKEGRKAGEYQFRFVAHNGMGVVQRNLAPGDPQHTEAVLFQHMVLIANTD
jgi:hypothetical protein